MTNTKLILVFILFTSLIFSCTQKEKANEETEETKTSEDAPDNASVFMQYSNAKKMKEIDDRIVSSQRVESLSWEKQTANHGSEFIEVVAYLNEDGFPMKITEYFVEGNFQPSGQRHYYLENKKLIAFQENSDIWVDSNFTKYVEKRTVYNDSKPVISQLRSANEFTEIKDSMWKIIPEEHHSLERVNKILTGTGEFETHFISVIKGESLFLLLGENKTQKEERYTTALRVDEKSPFIEDLLNNLEKYKFKPVIVNFEVVGGNNQPEFRVLTNIAWKNQ
ncbi:MAG TPA: hypothetical protein VKY37_10375 [Brumimicrobium sp.]|nr:hypothetical protein [Brumimicrobium sp.]